MHIDIFIAATSLQGPRVGKGKGGAGGICIKAFSRSRLQTVDEPRYMVTSLAQS